MADELVLASQRVEPQRLLDSGFSFTHPDGQKALAAALIPK
jgi:NAD dependent epimerase/dehydratase family enzyme